MAPISATSFYPTKPLGCYGDGGAILTEDDDLASAVRMIRSHGRQGTGDEAMVLGLTGRLDTIQAAVLLVKLDVFDRELARRREIAARYDAALGGAVVHAGCAGPGQQALWRSTRSVFPIAMWSGNGLTPSAWGPACSTAWRSITTPPFTTSTDGNCRFRSS